MNKNNLTNIAARNVAKVGKKIWVWILLALGALIPQLAFAIDIGGTGVNIASFSPPASDLSVALLGRIFGTVGGGLEAASATVFGRIFYVFNSAMLIVIGFILIYTIVKSIMEISHGEVGQMGRKFTGWHVARVVLGTGLVVPQATGYSVMNTIVMWVTIQGVGLADGIWTSVVDYLVVGGNAIYATTPGATTNRIEEELAYTGGSAGDDTSSTGVGMSSSDVLRSQMCMNALYNVIEAGRKKELGNCGCAANKLTSCSNCTDEKVKALAVPVSHFQAFPDTADGKAASFPYNVDNNLTKYPVLQYIPSKDNQPIKTQLDGICGNYDWSAKRKDYTSEENQKYIAAKETGLRQIVNGLSSIADTSINVNDVDKTTTAPKSPNGVRLFSTTDFSDSFNNTAFTSLASTAATYQSIVQPFRMNKSANNKNQSSLNPKDSLTNEGWISAGGFYNKLIKMQQANISADSSYKISTTILPPRCPRDGAACNDQYNKIITDRFEKFLGKSDSEKYKEQLKDRLSWKTKSDDSDKPGFSVYQLSYGFLESLNKTINEARTNKTDIPKALGDFARSASGKGVSISAWALPGTGIIFTPLNKALDTVFKRWYKLFIMGDERESIASPVAKLQDLGTNMIGQCFGFWRTLFATLGGLLYGYYAAGIATTIGQLSAAPGTFWGATVGVQSALQGVQHMITMTLKVFFEIPMAVAMPVASAVSVLLLTNGVILAYYIPMLPFMLFLFGVISWFMFVIEGMVAAPLVALGVTHPEGHDLMGKAEQTLMLLLSIFVRPAAMVIGLIAGIMLSYVALEVLNNGFGRVVCDVYYNNGTGCSADGSITGENQVRNAALIIVYTFIVMALMQQCFSLIHALPSSIMMWIGGPHKEGMEAQLAKGVESGVTQAAEKTGGAVGEGARSAAPSSSGFAFGGRKNEAKAPAPDKGPVVSPTPEEKL